MTHTHTYAPEVIRVLLLHERVLLDSEEGVNHSWHGYRGLQSPPTWPGAQISSEASKTFSPR